MTGNTHRVIGAGVGLGAMAVHPLAVALPASVFVGIRLPGMATWVLGATVLVALGMFVARLPDWDLRLGLPHRGMTHSFTIAVAVTVLAGLTVAMWAPAAAPEVATVTGISYLLHLAADLVNPTPMALLWPYPVRLRPRWLPATREGSWSGRGVEAIVTVAIVGLSEWWLWEALQPWLRTI